MLLWIVSFHVGFLLFLVFQVRISSAKVVGFAGPWVFFRGSLIAPGPSSALDLSSLEPRKASAGAFKKTNAGQLVAVF